MKTILLFIFMTTGVFAHEYCEEYPKQEQCVGYICDVLGSRSCNSNREVLEVLSYCRFNYGATCIHAAVSKLSKFDKKNRRKVLTLADSCRNQRNGDCIDTICTISSCTNYSDLLKIVRKCQGMRKLWQQ